MVHGSSSSLTASRFAGALLAVGVAGGSGCAHPAAVAGATAGAKAQPAMRPPAPLPAAGERPIRAWLRLDVPLRWDFEEPWRSKAPPRLLVDRFADGTLGAVGLDFPPALLSPRGRSSPTRSRGLGLFAQRRTDLHVESIGGPVVGWADAGAYLSVLGFGAGFVEVALTDHRALTPGVAFGAAFVESAALGVAESSAPFPPEARGDYMDVAVPMAAAPGGTPYAVTACGPLQVLERDGRRLRVAQSRDGVHVGGWLAEAPSRARGDNACDPRVVELGPRGTDVPRLPAGYVPYAGGDTLDDPLGPTLRRRGVVAWIAPGDDGALRCVDWTAQAEKAHDVTVAGVSGELRRETTTGGQRSRVVFSIAVGPPRGAAPSGVTLEGPSWSGSGEGVALCGTTYSIVAADSDRVTLLRGTYLDGLAGYRPEDAEVWYLSLAACEAARREADAAPLASSASSASSAWVHRSGC